MYAGNEKVASMSGLLARFSRVRLAVVTGLLALVAAVSISAVMPGNASAYAGNCRGGLNTATTAWGYCDYVGGPTYLNGFRLVVNCYYYPQRISYGTAGQSIYASCPGWSHVTGIFVQPWNG